MSSRRQEACAGHLMMSCRCRTHHLALSSRDRHRTGGIMIHFTGFRFPVQQGAAAAEPRARDCARLRGHGDSDAAAPTIARDMPRRGPPDDALTFRRRCSSASMGRSWHAGVRAARPNLESVAYGGALTADNDGMWTLQGHQSADRSGGWVFVRIPYETIARRCPSRPSKR